MIVGRWMNLRDEINSIKSIISPINSRRLQLVIGLMVA
jgi:hypothetical protein